jgi:hypothetical protein
MIRPCHDYDTFPAAVFEHDRSSFREKASESILFFRKKNKIDRISGLKKQIQLV